jgi:two-component system OmpR family response regulator
VLEDDPDSRELYALALTNVGFDAYAAATAGEALALAESIRPDVIVTDLMLPGTMNGAQFCQELTARGMPRMPTIGVTAHPDGAAAWNDPVDALAILIKPITMQDLVDWVREATGSGPSPSNGAS